MQKISDSEYDALPDSSKWIRLISVRRTRSNSISCELITVSTSMAPPYRALSYTWGGDAVRHQILLNGRRFWATNNLYDFLWVLAESERPEDRNPIWIDAICVYSDLSSIKHLRNLRFVPQVFWEVRFTHLASQIGQ